MPRKKVSKAAENQQPVTEHEEFFSEIEMEDSGEELDSDFEAEGFITEPAEPVIPTVVPQVAEDEHQRYELEPDRNVSVTDKNSYNSLRNFVDASGEKSKYHLCIFRIDPDDGNQKFLKRIEIPDGILEERLAKLFGGGRYRWQLAVHGRFAGRKDLPPSMRDIPMQGQLEVDAPPKDASESMLSQQIEQIKSNNSDSSRMFELVMNQMQSALDRERTSGRENASSMVTLMGTIMNGMQAQIQMSNTIAQQQNSFLMGLLEKENEKAKDQSKEKDDMWGRMLELVMKFTGNEDQQPKSTLETVMLGLKEIVPAIANSPIMQGAPHSPAHAAPAPAAVPAQALPAPAQASAAPPPAAPLDPEQEWPHFLTEVVQKAYQLFQSGVSPEMGAQVIDEIGSDEMNDQLKQLNDAQISTIIEQAHQQFLNQAAPPELIRWVREMWQHLLYEEEPEQMPQQPPQPPQQPQTVQQVQPAQEPVQASPEPAAPQQEAPQPSKAVN